MSLRLRLTLLNSGIVLLVGGALVAAVYAILAQGLAAPDRRLPARAGPPLRPGSRRLVLPRDAAVPRPDAPARWPSPAQPGRARSDRQWPGQPVVPGSPGRPGSPAGPAPARSRRRPVRAARARPAAARPPREAGRLRAAAARRRATARSRRARAAGAGRPDLPPVCRYQHVRAGRQRRGPGRGALREPRRRHPATPPGCPRRRPG